MVRGKHDIKVGGGIRANQMNVLAEGFQDGHWIYTGFWAGEPQADLLTGLPSLAIHDQTFNGNVTGRRWKLFRPFVEDGWRISKSLTLNLGLAWALVTPVTEAANRMADFNPANGQFLIAGQGASSSAGIQMDKTALEPRIGLAWKPFGSQTTVIRGGYAIFHDSSWNQGGQGLWENPPYFAESDAFAFGGACTFATSACATKYGLTPSAISASSGFPIFTSPPNPLNFTGTLQAQNLNFKQGRVQQFNVNVEHQLPGEVLLTVGYAGSRSSHILVDGNNINVGSPADCGKVAGYTLGCGPGGSSFGVPYSQFPFSTIDNNFDIGVAHYNSLQIKAETKSAKHGLYALIGYTYARAYDNGFTDGLGSLLGATYYPLPAWQTLDWGLSQINLNHSFTASLIYQLPFGKGKQFGSSWNLAFTYYRLNRFEDARAPLARAVERWPDIFQLNSLYGAVLLKLGEEGAACDALRRAHLLQPQDSGAANLLFGALLGLGRRDQAARRYPDALRSFDEAAKLHLADPEPHRSLAEIYRLTGHTSEAAAEQEQVDRLSKNPEKVGP